MAYVQKNSPFKQTANAGKETTSKSTGPEDPITYPSKKNLMYSRGNEYQYTRTLRDSLKNANLPVGNLFERGRQAQQDIAYGKDDHTEQEHNTARKIEKLISHTKHVSDPRRIHNSDDDRYALRMKGITERMLMNVEGQINKNKKKKQSNNNAKNSSQQKITGAIGSDLRKAQYKKKGWANDATTHPELFSNTKKKKKK